MLNALRKLKETLDNIQLWIDRQKLIPVLIEIESGGDDFAIGDKHLKNWAYGCLQIRKPYLEDVNQANKTSYHPTDCLGNRALSIWIFNRYMDIYATKERLGRLPTMEDLARIHNGGPNGYKNPATDGYWAKVKAKL